MSDVKRWCETPVNGGPWVVLASDYDAIAARLAEAERERGALVNTLETIAHDARKYHGELWSAEFAKSALSALERT